MPITTSLCDVDPSANTYQVLFADIMGGTPLYWLSVLISLGAICLPIYAAKVYEMVYKAP